MVATGRCLRNTALPDLWDEEPSLSRIFGTIRGEGRTRIAVRCPRDFEWLVFQNRWAAEHSEDAALMLAKLWGKLWPSSSVMFCRRYTAAQLITAADGQVQKAFVHSVILMSKWLGPEGFPCGVFVWPPPLTPEV